MEPVAVFMISTPVDIANCIRAEKRFTLHLFLLMQAIALRSRLASPPHPAAARRLQPHGRRPSDTLQGGDDGTAAALPAQRHLPPESRRPLLSTTQPHRENPSYTARNRRDVPSERPP